MLYLFSETPEQWTKRQERKSKEERRKYLKFLQKNISDRLGNIGFKSIILPDCTGLYDFKVKFIYRKYPNLYSEIKFGEKAFDNIITFHYYVNENMWGEFYLDTVSFLYLLGLLDDPEQHSWFENIMDRFCKKEYRLVMTEFDEMIENFISTTFTDYKAEPYCLMVKHDDIVKPLSKNDLKVQFDMCGGRVMEGMYFHDESLSDDGRIKLEPIRVCFDNIQKYLMKFILSDEHNFTD